MEITLSRLKEVDSMSSNVRDEEAKKMIKVIKTAPFQQVLSVAGMLSQYPITLTRLKLGNAIRRRRYDEFCRSLDKKKQDNSQSSFWSFFKFWGRKTDQKIQVEAQYQKETFYIDRLRQLDRLPLDVYKKQMQGLLQIIKNASMPLAKSIQNSINLFSMYGSHRNSNVRLIEAVSERQLDLMRVQRQQQNRKNSWWPFNKNTNKNSKDKVNKKPQQQKRLAKGQSQQNQRLRKGKKEEKEIGKEMQKKDKMGKAQKSQRDQYTQKAFQEEEVCLLAKQEPHSFQARDPDMQ